MSDKDTGNSGYDSCQAYEDLGNTYSEQRDNCYDAGCATATDFSAAAAYYSAAACYNSKK